MISSNEKWVNELLIEFSKMKEKFYQFYIIKKIYT